MKTGVRMVGGASANSKRLPQARWRSQERAVPEMNGAASTTPQAGVRAVLRIQDHGTMGSQEEEEGQVLGGEKMNLRKKEHFEVLSVLRRREMLAPAFAFSRPGVWPRCSGGLLCTAISSSV